tara:strand:- start:340 stop:489 length:150 start_codon:yes stop_codon:yes gene_type:complete
LTSLKELYRRHLLSLFGEALGSSSQEKALSGSWNWVLIFSGNPQPVMAL